MNFHCFIAATPCSLQCCFPSGRRTSEGFGVPFRMDLSQRDASRLHATKPVTTFYNSGAVSVHEKRLATHFIPVYPALYSSLYKTSLDLNTLKKNCTTILGQWLFCIHKVFPLSPHEINWLTRIKTTNVKDVQGTHDSVIGGRHYALVTDFCKLLAAAEESPLRLANQLAGWVAFCTDVN